MKTMAIFMTMILVLTAAPVFAGTCGGGCDKDKDEQTVPNNIKFLYGGDNDNQSGPSLMCDSCGCKGNVEDCDKDKEEGCGKDKEKGCCKPKSEAAATPQCSSSGCDKDKDRDETKV